MSPIHEYTCPKCGKFEDITLSAKEKPLKKCPTCKADVTRLIGTGIGVKFVGFGWPSNDIKNPPPPPSSMNKRSLKKKRAKLRKEGFQNKFHPKRP